MGALIDTTSGRTEGQKGRDLKTEADPGTAPPHRVTPLGLCAAPSTQLAPPTALPPAESHLCLSDNAGARGSPSYLFHSILRGVNFASLFTADGWSLQSLAANPMRVQRPTQPTPFLHRKQNDSSQALYQSQLLCRTSCKGQLYDSPAPTIPE